ncbi:MULTISPECIES: SPOR domain-containing protein [Burkholderiaceae]|uniref:SPOR domain-containing protein n=1 Tax=Burkholderiaceae TaxID=119060 RepID=UPI000961FF1F|nr:MULTISPECIES: SPOR domain-containing protein [Burkholderiaceae]MCF2134366.1 SPOR domain-containing protein [Mycetohabitans sp. B3]MCG1039818.1 SPOR domain-containing protein [Mycetohabitans sp. B7]SIT71068.1 DedD protein [Burkholderia sp. b14]
MGLFSFGSKDNAGPSRTTAGSRAGRTSRREQRAERRPDPDAMLLDPTLPEKQRARRRLVGAIALVVAAVVALPMILDSQPKPFTDDIAIHIPARLESAPASSHAHGDEVMPATAPPPRGKTAMETGRARAQSGANASFDASSPGGTPNAPAGNRYVVQLGALNSDAAARDWVGRLKALGVPAYVERRRQSDGSERILLRAGPFADRSAAAAAVAKVREAGLTSGGDSKRTQ